MNSPFNNRPSGGQNPPPNNGGGREGRFSETVIMDNKFHQKLSNVRNRDVADNHPDIEIMKREAQQQSQRHLATMYRMPAIKDPNSPSAAEAGAETISQKAVAMSAARNFHDCMRRLEMETKRCNKFNRPFSLAIIGFDALINVANTYGVLAYDQALAHIDAVLCNVVDTDIDTVGRYSNDRFFMLLPECTGPNSTMVAETTRQFFESVPITHQDHSFFLKASIGIACFPNHGRDWKEILARADLACEAVLSKGGNAFGFASMM